MASLPASRLTDKQAEFVSLISQGVPKVRAAALAGYAHANVEPSRLLALPHVQAALQLALTKTIRADLAPLAIGRLKGILLDQTAPAQHVIKAADVVLKAAGAHKAGDSDSATHGKSLADMGKGELEDLVTRLRTAVGAHEAKTIDAAPDSITVIEDPLDKLIG